MSKEEFKNFAKQHPTLAKYVNNGTMTWQKFYDMYRLYGEDTTVWKEYLEENKNTTTLVREDTTIKDLVNMMKNIDLEKVRKGIDGVQKAISLIQDLGNTQKKEEYEPRPIYRHLDD